jgi:hypothetical protein
LPQLRLAVKNRQGKYLHPLFTLDTGADRMVMPTSLAEGLSIPYVTDRSAILDTLGGQISGYHGRVTVHSNLTGAEYSWPCFFSEKWLPPLIGRAGFLDDFTAEINGDLLVVRPRSVHPLLRTCTRVYRRFRPYPPVRVRLGIRALTDYVPVTFTLDTGADHLVLSAQLAEERAITYETSHPGTVATPGGPVQGYFSYVKVRYPAGGPTAGPSNEHRWPCFFSTKVGNYALLGRIGLLDEFAISIDGKRPTVRPYHFTLSNPGKNPEPSWGSPL